MGERELDLGHEPPPPSRDRIEAVAADFLRDGGVDGAFDGPGDSSA